MSKKGYQSLSIDDELAAILDNIARTLVSPTGDIPKRPRVIKFLVDEYNRNNQAPEEEED